MIRLIGRSPRLLIALLAASVSLNVIWGGVTLARWTGLLPPWGPPPADVAFDHVTRHLYHRLPTGDRAAFETALARHRDAFIAAANRMHGARRDLQRALIDESGDLPHLMVLEKTVQQTASAFQQALSAMVADVLAQLSPEGRQTLGRNLPP